MNKCREYALTTLLKLVGCCFRYGLKSHNMDLYDLGFGEDVHFLNCLGNTQTACKHTLHFTCGIKLFWKDGRINEFGPTTESPMFSVAVEPLIGTVVRRIALSDKNDLWIDLDSCKMVIVTYEDSHESWRYFSPGTGSSHLISSGQHLYFE